MPIPINESKEVVRTPNVAVGKAVDPSQYILGTAQANLAAMGYINQNAKEFGQFFRQLEANEEERIAQDAFNQYLTKRNEEDLILNEKKNMDAVNYEKKYYTNNEKSHKEFVQAINSIPNQQIREKYRQLANEKNIKLHSSAQEYIFNQRENAEALSLKGTQELMSKTASDSLSHIVPQHNTELFEGNFAQADEITREYYERHGYPPEAVEMLSQDLRNKFLVDAADHLASQTGGLKPAIDLIRSQKDKLNHDDFKKIAKHYEDQYLNLEFAKNPNQFIVNGEYSDAIASQYAPDLTEEERRKRITDASSNGSSLSGQQLNDQMTFESQWYNTHILQGFNDYLNDAGTDVDIKKIKEGAANGDLKIGEFMQKVATAAKMLKQQAGTPDAPFNMHSPEFVKTWTKKLDQMVSAYIPNTKSKATKNGFLLSDNATVADVTASKIHHEFDKYRKRNIRFWIFGKKDPSELLFQEADAISEALKGLPANGVANWKDVPLAQRRGVIFSMSSSLAKNHPEYDDGLQNALHGLTRATEEEKKKYDQVEADFNKRTANRFYKEYERDSFYKPIAVGGIIAMPAGGIIYESPFNSEEKDFFI